ncbi:protease SohB [Aurantivibrio infirmus]
MEFLAEYGLFFAKAVTLVIAIVVVILIIVAASQKNHRSEKGHIDVVKLNDRYNAMHETIQHAAIDEAEFKLNAKQEKKQQKKEKADKKKELKHKSPDAELKHKKRVFVLNFHGDMKASATDNLREEITTVLSLAKPEDEVVLCLESTGGMVHSYGLAASQLSRIKSKNVPLTVCVDKVAASGGYMMACVADKIISAPFAVIGSIGVVAQLPNFNRLLKKIPVDYEMQTAGEYKRTLTIFGENTDKAREKFSEELEDTHGLFKEFIRSNRPGLDVDKVATGETWYGSKALENNLIDEVKTSDEYLTSHHPESDIFEVTYHVKKSIPEKFGFASQAAMDRLLLTWWERLQSTRFFS